MIGQRLSHYLIEERLGEGGMGEVFLARDLALGRPAAIKVLPPAFDPALRRRLLAEAESSRRLQHPGIATFFESGTTGSTDFIAMEFVRGETLRRKVQGGPLPPATAYGIAAGLLEALGHAHRAGIIHRDIKPENIIITPEGAAKLLDFGIARRTGDGDGAPAATRTSLTDTGAVIGSVGYMAPEQLRAEAVDARADLFAVGAVLYEMLSGHPAFGGATPAERITATLFREVAPLAASLSEAAGIVQRALTRPTDGRYATAAEFLRDLRRLGEGGMVVAYPDTVAILDFENRTARAEDAWIGSAFAEQLAADLGPIAGVGIVPRPRVLRAAAAARADDPAALGGLLGCRWVLSGSYQRVRDSLRVLMHVTHVPTERLIATEKLDGLLGDIFGMQDRLGRRAAEALELGGRETAKVVRQAPALDAYERFTQGVTQWGRMTKGGMDRAEELFEEALRQQPGYADALAGLAAVHDMRFTFTTDRTELDQAIAHARRAVELDPRHALAHVWLAYAQWRRGDLDAAIETIRNAGDLDAVSHYPPYFLACMLLDRGEPAASLEPYQCAVARGPGFGFGWVGLAYTHMELGHYREADWSFGKAVELEHGGFHATAGAAGYLGESLRRQGHIEEARRQCLAGIVAVESTDHMYRDTLRAICLNVLGRAALDQGDRDAAQAAFRQSELHLGGRPRTLSGGHLTCQALAGRAVAEGDRALHDAAVALFEKRDRLDWSWIWQGSDDVTRGDLARSGAATAR